MKYVSSKPQAIADVCPAWPDPWRMVLILFCALILCSCRGTAGSRNAALTGRVGGDSLPGEAYASDPAMAAAPAALVSTASSKPLDWPEGDRNASGPQGPWSPPGIRQPWPEDEYVRDGGDEGRQAGITGQGELRGVEMEDTVARYETRDGRTVVEPSNEVYLYSPRFGAVRQVVGLAAEEDRQHAGGVHSPQNIDAPSRTQIVTNAKQNVQLDDSIGARPASALRTKQGDGALSSAIGPNAFQNAFKPYENLAIVRAGAYDEAEMALVARGAAAAVAWSHTQAVQILLGARGAMAEVKYDNALSVYTACEPPGRPKLRVYKTASAACAKPGDTVDFTIRFDNIGNQPLDRVTVIDSLNTRLEYVEKSAQCNLEAKFSTPPNDGGSTAMCCELSQPLKPGQGGILRFQCRVR